MNKHELLMLMQQLMAAQSEINAAKDRLTHAIVLLQDSGIRNGMLYHKIDTMLKALYADEIHEVKGGDSKYFVPGQFAIEAALNFTKLPEGA